MIKNHITPALGRIRLRQLEPWHIQKYYAEKMREGRLDSNSVHKYRILLHTVLQLAYLGLRHIFDQTHQEVLNTVAARIEAG